MAGGTGRAALGPAARVLAIDAGTTGVRTVAVDVKGAVVDGAYRELTQYFPRPGWVEHDPGEILAAAHATLAEVAARQAAAGASVAAVGITNQRETVVAFDRRSGRPLHRAIVWQDRRTAAACQRLQEAGHLPLVRAKTGLVLDPYFSATKMAWLLGEGGVGGAAGGGAAGVGGAAGPGDLALGTVDSWLLWNLTGGRSGGIYATDPTNASRTSLYDIVERRWSEELCDLFGVPIGALAEVRPSSGDFGRIGAARGRTAPDLPKSLLGVPVTGIAGDQHAALFGQACFEPGSAKATYGTGTFVLVNAGPEPPAPAPGLLTTIAWDLGSAGGPEPRAYALEGSAFSSGSAIQWLRDGLGLIDRSDEIGPLAGSVPDSGGLAFVPAFTGLGSPVWDPRARGTVAGITRGSGRAQLARAVVEAIAFEVRAILEAMTAAGHPVSVLRADGGAAAMNLLLQLQADVAAVPVARPRELQSTARGAAMLAGLAGGVWGSPAELASLWHADVQYRPAPDAGGTAAAYAVWQRAVNRSRNWARG
jgi:glycerol kinase